jgi:integrase
MARFDRSLFYPAMMWMRYSRFASQPMRTQSLYDDENIKSFSELQWSYIMTAAEKMANEQPEQHERTLFLVSLMYSCYLRISEVAARPGFSPVMGQFRRDTHSGVWGFFIPVSKGGKRRTVAVSNQLLKALERYRNYLGLPSLPTPNENTPLFLRHKAAGRGRDAGLRNANLGIRQLRDEINYLINIAADLAQDDGFEQDAHFILQQTSDPTMTLNDFWEIYKADMEKRLRKTTMKQKEYVMKDKVLPYFGNTPINAITAPMIRKWQGEMIDKGFKPTYLKTINNQLSSILNYAVRFYELRSNPCHKAGSMGESKADERPYWTLEEFQKTVFPHPTVGEIYHEVMF